VDRLLPLILFLILPVTALSSDKDSVWTGNELLRRCKLVIAIDNKRKLSTNEILEAYSCISYIDGVVDGYNASRILIPKLLTKSESEKRSIGKKIRIFCNRDNLTKGQTVRVVIKSLEKDPEYLHINASALIITALARAFPCKNKK